MPSSGSVNVGFTLPSQQVEDLDEVKRRWDEWEARNISRSEAAREALAIGIAALDVMDDELGPESARMATQERRAAARQALLNLYDESE